MGGKIGANMNRMNAHWVGTRALLTTLGLTLGAACTNHPEEGTMIEPGTGVETVPGGGKRIQAAAARPIMGGTLATNKDGTIAVASDPDRDAVFVVELERRVVTPIRLEAGEVPGRIAMGADSDAYVVLRDAGAVARIDLDRQRLVERYPVCSAPRGIAFDAGAGLLHVTCQSGTLVTLDAKSGKVARQVSVADDLRDVVVSGDQLVLTTFRSAEIIVLNADGEIQRRVAPRGDASTRASVAWRAVSGSDGRVHVVHQMSDTGAGVSTGPSGYSEGGGACSFSVVRPAVTTLALDAADSGEAPEPLQLLGGAGPTDIAVSEQGRVAVVIAGNAWTDLSSVRRADTVASIGDDCMSTDPSPGEPVAVAFDAKGNTVVQSREPAALYLENGGVITLSTESHASTGLALFHMNTGTGIACASCHPEGMDDGQTWNFTETSWRRTQNVAGGIAARAPYHWDGDMEDFNMLVNEVMVGRMSLPIAPNDQQQEAFLSWTDGVARPMARLGDPNAVERGKALFFDSEVGCNECHTGPQLTNRGIFDVGTGGAFVVPSLVGIAARAPFLHDGCAPTLRDRFSPCGGGDRHGKTSHLSDAELDDLVTYLESL